MFDVHQVVKEGAMKCHSDFVFSKKMKSVITIWNVILIFTEKIKKRHSF